MELIGLKLHRSKNKETENPVQPHPHYVPEIKLCGKWLKQLGIEQGSDVLITLQDRRLVTEPVR